MVVPVLLVALCHVRECLASTLFPHVRLTSHCAVSRRVICVSPLTTWFANCLLFWCLLSGAGTCASLLGIVSGSTRRCVSVVALTHCLALSFFLFFLFLSLSLSLFRRRRVHSTSYKSHTHDPDIIAKTTSQSTQRRTNQTNK